MGIIRRHHRELLFGVSIDSSVFDGGTITLYTGSTAADAGDLLATGTIPAHPFENEDEDGMRALRGSWSMTATKNGTARGLLLSSADESINVFLTVTESGGGGDIIIDNDDVQINDIIAIATLAWDVAGTPTEDGLYFMSNEVAGVSSLLIDDFRRGYWAHENGDRTPSWQSVIPGWRMDLSAGDPGGGTPFVPVDAARDLNAIGKKPLFTDSNWVATSGVVPRGGLYPNSRNQAAHNLLGGSAGHNELYFRRYVFFVPANYYGVGNPAADYSFGAQKFLTINRYGDDAGIYWGGTGIDSGPSGVPGPSGRLFMVNNHALSPVGGDKRLQNQSNDITLVAGKWYCIEDHYKLNTNGNSDGTWELWVNDGGLTGDFSAQTPTLRARYTTVDFGFTSAELALMGNLWMENWSNPVSAGEQFWANLHAATSGPIGFAP